MSEQQSDIPQHTHCLPPQLPVCTCMLRGGSRISERGSMKGVRGHAPPENFEKFEVILCVFLAFTVNLQMPRGKA